MITKTILKDNCKDGNDDDDNEEHPAVDSHQPDNSATLLLRSW